MQPLGTQEKIDVLLECGPLKVWSLIVTILGDLCLSRQDRIPGKTLHLLTNRMGVSDQAVRVALHRLRRNGWVESQRDGRESSYALSEMGWAETQAVRARIYSGALPDTSQIRLIVAPAPTSELAEVLPADAVVIAPRTALVSGHIEDLPDGFLASRFDQDQMPGWAGDLLAGKELRQDYATLADSVETVTQSENPVDTLDRTVLRLLILHHWRRLRLRHGILPDCLLGTNWEGARARNAVMSALDTLDRPQIKALSQTGAAAATG